MPLPLAYETHVRATEPRKGDLVWNLARFEEGNRQPNGSIIDIDDDERVAIVRYFDGSLDQIDFNSLEGQWTDRFGGVYILEDLIWC